MSINHEIEWKKTYSTGSKLIDSQHQELVEMTNALFRACASSGHDEEMLSFIRTIRKAENYAKIHLVSEEEFMQKTKNPKYATLKAECDDFVTEVQKQIKKFDAGDCVPLDFALFLKKWVLNHIAATDKKDSPIGKNIKDKKGAPKN
ncbi:MAG: bacteriohemerythrin [Spirochaetaceae bacterium]|nr:bacteriohemerythrin [Spirochaetaceae bacterium]